MTTNDAETILEGLDDAQRAAATALEGPVRIVAGAGAGKTRTVTRRIAYACAKGKWRANRILAVTFSVKAADEMKQRLTKLGVGDEVTAATFHSVALQQLRTVWYDISEAPLPHVVDDPQEIVARALKRATNTDQYDGIARRNVLAEINWAKVSLIAPGDYVRVCAATHRIPPAELDPQAFSEVYLAYEQEKTARGEMDFNDILLLDCHVLEAFDEQAAQIRQSIGWLTVDEYQDVSPLQHRLMQLWLGENRNVCVVGDPAQTIYSFAGASSYDLLHFSDEFGRLTADVNLNTDYRSVPQVVSAANQLLSAAPDRDQYLRLVSARDKSAGMRVVKTAFEDDEQEAMGVAKRIAQFVAGGAKPSECAVLTRLNVQQQVVCKALKELAIPYQTRRDMGSEGLVLQDENASRREALEILANRKEHGVTISSVHASKGLEFKHVFIIGCSEGLLPYGSPAPGEALEEERRLFYVAVTRAEDSLHLSYARSKDAGSAFARLPSRFW
ncbi:DNA helicase-2/ATP-dependent DNA helicase PcrA [Bifidobacterium commune]|uniref:DNA 3'-5' helicase n=1 Tax=Bifidobacterium commune TaxID=1505727 RepID=A0A1C4GZP0_9BIFI|nr:ATP-dependent helicase [Bifidobacterium commune]MBB2955234.1 DNA helicase-2/ATP-dependent DNA helicase PcrA [Bifidobacterium commune]SCC78116.1 DNA helicase-2 / ATP-dependent DNA helicase PcrA [Bifidobacterium commune]